VEKVYERSGSLNGDAVVIFARALAAVSQEELVPVRPGEAPRCAAWQQLLQKVLESRLW